MRTMLAFALMLCFTGVAAQRECTSATYAARERSLNKSTEKNILAAEAFINHTPLISSAAMETRTEGSNTIRIPVVIHIVYNTTAQNISDAQVQSQLKVLNEDFRKRNRDTINTPLRFKPFAADVNIEFVLATTDPKGRPTTGIIRKKTGVVDWGMDDKIKYNSFGGDDGWDSKSYLNIWVGNTRKILGYSSVLGGASDKDGVVINTTAFGTINTAQPYHLGRTAVHEIGHWLGLKHIWGDAPCGDDGVEDTPPQASYTTGCPTDFRSSCTNGSLGDMYMNYMDFTNDACLNLFTEGQKQLMRNAFNYGGPRASLLNSKGLGEPYLLEASLPIEEVAVKQITLYPNPATTDISINFNGDISWIKKELSLINSNGATVLRFEVSGTTQKINLSNLKPGVYMVHGENEGKKIAQKFIKL
ncbi:MAG: T9SS type A sorting domain-containing protein [Chitinophagaceae bacterium]